MTDEMREKLLKFTDIQPVVIEGWPDAHHVFFWATNQRFCITPHGCETKEEAEFMRDMFCVALEKVIREIVVTT